MADFLHCNACMKSGITDRSVKYWLTECEKVFCNQCIDTNVRNCVKCSPNKCRTIELNSSTKPEIQLCFQELSSSFRKLEKVENFQKYQRIHLIQKLFAENKRLVKELEDQKQLVLNLQNETNVLRQQLDSRSEIEIVGRDHNTFEDLFNASDNNKINNGHKSIVKDLFKSEPKNQLIYANNQMNDIENEEPMNQTMNSMKHSMQMSNQYNPINQLIANNSSSNANMCAMSSRNTSLSPLQSIVDCRKTKISLRPKNPSPMKSRHSDLMRHPLSSQTNRHLNGFRLPPMSPMTFTKRRAYPISGSTLSYGSGRTGVNEMMSSKTPPSTNCSSIMSLSSLYRKTRISH